MIDLMTSYFSDVLQSSGIKRKPLDTYKELKLYQGLQVGAVLIHDDALKEDGSKRKFINDEGVKVKRVTKYKRNVKFIIIIGAKDKVSCNDILTKFLIGLAPGMDDGNGNWIDIEVLDSDWIKGEDNPLKSKVVVQLLIKCGMGIYKDYPYKSITSFDITMNETEG